MLPTYSVFPIFLYCLHFLCAHVVGEGRLGTQMLLNANKPQHHIAHRGCEILPRPLKRDRAFSFFLVWLPAPSVPTTNITWNAVSLYHNEAQG